tara:strand:+ start:48 stop:2969 length:2922 start_codon:yes stop_codon:yes gene_type:complete
MVTEEQERKLERRQSRLKPKEKSLAEQERELEAKQTRLAPRYKTKVDASLEMPTTFYSAPKSIPSQLVQVPSKPQAPPKPVSQSFYSKAMSYIKTDLPKQPVFAGLPVDSIPINKGLQTWLAPIGVGQTGKITPRVSHLVELTGIPYISREVQKVPWSDLDDIATNPKKTKEAVKLLGEYGLGIAGSLPPLLALNQALEQQGIKSIVPIKSEQEIATLPFGDMIFVPAERKAELERFRKQGGYNPNTFWANVQTAFRPIDLILTGTIAKGLVKIPVKTTQKTTTWVGNKNQAKKIEKLETDIVRKITQSSLNKSMGNNVKTPLLEAEWKALGDKTFEKKVRLRLQAIADGLDDIGAQSIPVKVGKDKGYRATGQEQLTGLEIVKENLRDYSKNILPEDLLRIKAGEFSIKTQKALETKLKKYFDAENQKAGDLVLKEANDILKVESRLPEARKLNKPQKDLLESIVPDQIEEIVKKSDKDFGKKANELKMQLRNEKNAIEKKGKELKEKDKELNELKEKGSKQYIARLQEKQKIQKELDQNKSNEKKLLEDIKANDKELNELKQKAKDQKDKGSPSTSSTSKPKPPQKDKGDLGTETKTPSSLKLKEKPVDTAKDTIKNPIDNSSIKDAIDSSVFFKRTDNVFAPKDLVSITPDASLFKQVLISGTTLKSKDIQLWGNGIGDLAISQPDANKPSFKLDLEKEGTSLKISPLVNIERASSPWVEIAKPKDYIVNIPIELKPVKDNDSVTGKPKIDDGLLVTGKPSKRKDTSVKIPDEVAVFKGKIVGDEIKLEVDKPSRSKFNIPTKTPDITRTTAKARVEEKIEDPEKGKAKNPKEEPEKAKTDEGKKIDDPKPKIKGEEGKKTGVKGRLPKRKKIKDIKLKKPNQYGYLFTWQQGNQYPVANLLTNKVRYTRVRPRNLPMGNTVAETFTVLKSSKQKPQVKRLDIGKFFANISRGGVQFELKKKNLKKKYKY